MNSRGESTNHIHNQHHKPIVRSRNMVVDGSDFRLLFATAVSTDTGNKKETEHASNVSVMLSVEDYSVWYFQFFVFYSFFHFGGPYFHYRTEKTVPLSLIMARPCHKVGTW